MKESHTQQSTYQWSELHAARLHQSLQWYIALYCTYVYCPTVAHQPNTLSAQVLWSFADIALDFRGLCTVCHSSSTSLSQTGLLEIMLTQNLLKSSLDQTLQLYVAEAIKLCFVHDYPRAHRPRDFYVCPFQFFWMSKAKSSGPEVGCL